MISIGSGVLRFARWVIGCATTGGSCTPNTKSRIAAIAPMIPGLNARRFIESCFLSPLMSNSPYVQTTMLNTATKIEPKNQPSSPSSSFCSGRDMKPQFENITENCSTFRRAISFWRNTRRAISTDTARITSAVTAAVRTLPSVSIENSRWNADTITQGVTA